MNMRTNNTQSTTLLPPTHTQYTSSTVHNQVTIEVHTSGSVYGLDGDKSSEQSEFVFQFVSVPQVNQNFQNLS